MTQPEDLLSIETTDDGLRASGEIDAHTAPTLAAALDAAGVTYRTTEYVVPEGGYGDALVDALGLDVDFAPREELRTEISAKFSPERLRGDLAASGLDLREVLTDPDDLFALSLSTPVR